MNAVTEFATRIRISPNPPVFDLPILVALEHGLFAKVGLDIDYSVNYADHDKLEKDVLKRQKEALFDSNAAPGVVRARRYGRHLPPRRSSLSIPSYSRPAISPVSQSVSTTLPDRIIRPSVCWKARFRKIKS